MINVVPNNPKIYHILHVDRLDSVIETGGLVSDLRATRSGLPGTNIGMSHIKERRRRIKLQSHAGLRVGACVPFYFCPRSIMLHKLHLANDPELSFKGGQTPIVHLEADLRRAVDWADFHGKRWAFTNSNAGSYYFEDYADLSDLGNVDWRSVKARYWPECREQKQAEYLLEDCLPWHLIDSIGVLSRNMYSVVHGALQNLEHQPRVAIRPDWYY